MSRRIGILLRVAAWVLALFVVACLGLGVYLYDVSQSLPDLEVDPDSLKAAQTSIVYAADGSVLAEWHGEEDRTIIPYANMPEHLRDAVVSIEDQRFYEHNGVDVQGIMRALKKNASAGEVQQGGSTITQQLVKILFTEGERTLDRKVREALLAYELEARADKDQVLGTYMNTVYFGRGAYGVESAARRFFGTRTESLSLAQSALLAGVIRSPSAYDPVKHPDEALVRRDLVLSEMRKQGHISLEQELAAASEPLVVAQHNEVSQFAPYFVEYVKQDMIDRLGEDRVYRGGLRIYTTLEPAVQRIAEKSARQLSRESDPEVALVAVRHADGAVLAMVGGRDFSKNQFNLAAQGRRQPGSAFKPFVLVTALEQGVQPHQTFAATPFSVPVKDGVWKVQNYENAVTQKRLTLQAATNWSVNTVYARLIMRVGADKVAATAQRLGIQTTVNPDPAIALGGLKTGVSPLEMAAAFGTLANGGMRVPPSGIVKVTDDQGQLVYEPERTQERVLDRSVAMRASLMLHDVVERGTGSAARFGPWAAGKTGTTQSYRDAWFVGWSGDLTTAVWVGHPEAQVPMTKVHGIKVTGGSFPAKIWAQFMRGATNEMARPVTPKTAAADRSSGEEANVKICQDSMLLANKKCPRTVDIYLDRDLVPSATCAIH